MEHDLNVRDLEPPEPMERILAALETLPAGDRLRVCHRREPFPLYNLLRNMDYAWDTHYRDGCFDILIWKAERL